MIGAALLAAALGAAPVEGRVLREERFTLATAAEVQAVVSARCGGCDWGRRGSEAAVLAVSVDGRPWSEIVLARREGDHAITLGPLPAGAHRLSVALDRRASAARVGTVAVDSIRVEVVDDPVAAHSPIVVPRPDALRRFSDVPLLLWAETDTTPRGRRIRYSVVFSNEDGGTPPDRLMATWGRLTDIEYVYGVELDASGRILHEEIQGREHRILPFRGRKVGRHPVLYVVTDNNMLDEKGGGTRRHAPAPIPFDLAGVSREAVMDAHPWTYAVSAAEAAREGRVDEAATPGSGRVPDLRRFVTVEACAEVRDASLTFAVATRGPGGALRWHRSDDEATRFRIARSADHFPNGCFRGAVALPPGTRDDDIAGLRFRAYARVPKKGEPPLPPGASRATVRRVNRLFRLREDHTPGADLFTWTGRLPLTVDGSPAEVPFRGGSAWRSCARACRGASRRRPATRAAWGAARESVRERLSGS